MTAVGEFSPSPGAARRGTLLLRHARMETRLVLRNGEQLLLAGVIPLLVLVAGAVAARQLGLGGARPIDQLAPGVLALAIMSTSFTSLAVATGFERRYGVLEQLGTTPLGRDGLLAGKIVSLLMIQAGQLTVLVLVALALGWHPHLSVASAVAAVLLWWLGCAAFAAWALAMAGTLRAEVTLGLANLIFVVLLVGGGIVVPAERYGVAAGLVRLLPSGALAEGLRAALGAARVDWWALLVLLAWSVAGTVVTARTFRWS